MELFNLSWMDAMSRIPDCSASLVIVDASQSCPADSLSSLWTQVKRICQAHATVLIFARGMFVADVMKSNIEAWRYNLIWNTSLKIPTKGRPIDDYEYIVVFSQGTPVFHPQLIQTITTKVNCPGKPKKKRISLSSFPCSILDFQALQERPGCYMKPKSLFEYLIFTYTNKNALVVDCGMHNGASGVAAVNTARRFIGAETDPTLFSMAKNAITEAVFSQAESLFDGDDLNPNVAS